MDSPIFIVGCPRSGTTLMRLILNRHSNIAIPEETWYYPVLYNELSRLTERPTDWQRYLSKRILALNSVHFPDLQPHNLYSLLEKEKWGDWPSIIPVVNKFYAQNVNKQRWGDKTPGYVMHLPLIKRLYPEAKVIHMVRDGRDVVPSILKYWSVGPQTNSLLETAYYWKKRVTTGLKQGPLYFKENYLQIKYEDLVEHPELMIKKICQFIDEQFEPQMLARSSQPEIETMNWAWHSETKKEINRANVGKWEKTISEYDLRSIELIGRDVFVLLGYPLQSKRNVKARRDVFCYNLNLRKKRLVLKVKVLILRIIKPEVSKVV